MSSIERSAYTVALEIGSSDKIIRSMLFPATGDDRDGYKQRVWRDIMRSLSEANKRVETEVVSVLTRAVHQHAHRAEIEEKLGPSVTGRIYELVAARELPEWMKNNYTQNRWPPQTYPKSLASPLGT